jgi:hypothetical protein
MLFTIFGLSDLDAEQGVLRLLTPRTFLSLYDITVIHILISHPASGFITAIVLRSPDNFVHDGLDLMFCDELVRVFKPAQIHEYSINAIRGRTPDPLDGYSAPTPDAIQLPSIAVLGMSRELGFLTSEIWQQSPRSASASAVWVEV